MGECGGSALVDDCGICDGSENDGDIDNDGNECELLSIDSSLIPYKYGITNIYPNPFNPIANIQFEISEITHVTLSIYDLNGRQLNILIDNKMNPGQYSSLWSGTDMQGYQVSSGIYLAVLGAENQKFQTRKMVLLK